MRTASALAASTGSGLALTATSSALQPNAAHKMAESGFKSLNLTTNPWPFARYVVMLRSLLPKHRPVHGGKWLLPVCSV